MTEAKMKNKLRLPKSYAIIFGAFNLGFYVAIQGPTLMDLIDILHINYDTMSYSLAFASLAYSVGGLLSGFLFNYVDRQVLIAAFYIIFGISNIITPFITSFMIFSIVNVFKMMCAGGTDCGANVWILELWPGKDEWLQAIHFFFAVGCALGPLVVEPFLSEESHGSNGNGAANLTGSSMLINESGTPNEVRIYIPFGVSGSMSILAALIILYLNNLDKRMKRVQLARCQKLASNSKVHDSGKTLIEMENVQLQLQAPAQIEPLALEEAHIGSQSQVQEQTIQSQSEADVRLPKATAHSLATESPKAQAQSIIEIQQQPSDQNSPAKLEEQQQNAAKNPAVQVVSFREPPKDRRGKITSKSEEREGLPPYYVMFAVLLAAMSLSFYCGVEITSMNYLATFAMNIDLALHKSTAVLMSSALTISFMVGRGLGIYLAARMKPHKLFYLCASVMVMGNMLMLVFANTAELWLWSSICLFGVGCGPMLPAVISFFDYKISKVTNPISGVFISGSMVIVALNSLIIGHHIIDNALILIICNLVGSVFLLLLFGTLHMLAKVKRHQRIRKYKLKRMLFDQQTANQSLQSSQSQEQQQQPQNTSQEASCAISAATAANELATVSVISHGSQGSEQAQIKSEAS